MPDDFDHAPPYENTGSVKWEFHKTAGGLAAWDVTDPARGREQMLPMWVADMDFACAPAIVDALRRRAEQPVYGHTAKTDGFLDATVNWLGRRHGWRIDSAWLRNTPGVVPAINLLIQTFTEPGQSVLIQPPVYHPFARLIEDNERRIVNDPLSLADGRYGIDLDDLADKAGKFALHMMVMLAQSRLR